MSFLLLSRCQFRMALQIPVEGYKNERALAGLRVRTLRVASAHSQGRECAVSLL